MMLLNDQKHEMGRKTMKDKFFFTKECIIVDQNAKKKNTPCRFRQNCNTAIQN